MSKKIISQQEREELYKILRLINFMDGLKGLAKIMQVDVIENEHPKSLKKRVINKLKLLNQ